MKRPARVLSALLAATLALGTIPLAAVAEDVEPTIGDVAVAEPSDIEAMDESELTGPSDPENYEGTITASFRTDLLDSTPTVILSPTTFTYDGTVKKPKVTVKVGDITLPSSDYDVAYRDRWWEEVNPIQVGTYTVEVGLKGNYHGYGQASFEITPASAHSWKRLAGKGRYDTMARIVQEGWYSRTDCVIVATGYSFKDALSAAGLAGLDDTPVVLTDGGKGGKATKLSAQARSELKRLNPSFIYVIGGEAAISKGVVDDIYNTLPDVYVDRLAGKTSASTSAEIAFEGDDWWEDDTAIIATNKTFKDALSVAPLSYALHWPILLADNGKSLNPDVLEALEWCGIKQVYIVGGKLAVTENVEKQLAKANIKIAGRLEGKNGVQTSRKIADFALQHGLTVKNMAFATSQNFPDALAGAALCGMNRSVLLLCDDKAQSNFSFATTNKAQIEIGYVFGGTSAFSDDLYARLPYAKD